MNEIKRIDRYHAPQKVHYTTSDENNENAFLNILEIMYRRWKTILAATLIICAVLVPVMWIAGKDYYESEGAIRVTPIISPILFRDFESDRPIPNYDNFVNTQASLLASNNVINRVADELSGKNLEFFEDDKDLAIALKIAVKRGDIKIEPLRMTELVKLNMKTAHPRQAEIVLNAFLKSYMNIIATEEIRGGDEKIRLLENKRREIANLIDQRQEEIRRLGEEYGTVVLGSRQDMMFQQVISLQNELTSVEIRRLSLEASANLQDGGIENSVSPAELMQMRNAFIESDLVLRQMSTDIAEQEAIIMDMKEVMSAKNARLLRQENVLASLKKSLEERRIVIIEKFNKEFKSAMEQNQSLRLVDLDAELKRTIDYENRLRNRLQNINAETVKMGRKQLAINNLQEKLERTKETYNAVVKRIGELEMERQRQTRVTVAYKASSVPVIDKKLRYTIVIFFVSLFFSSAGVLALEKFDTSLKKPEDVSKKTGIRVIGTTTSPHNIDNIMLGRQLSDDYQTIRANLGLLDQQSEKKIIAVTSAGVGDGKTTFAVNLATSFARCGEKTLLIDGDLRKPDIAATLNLSNKLRGLQEVLLEGVEIHRAAFRMPSTGLYVLASDRSNTSDALDILGQSATSTVIKRLADNYDRVIIDTPPVLAFADALLWAKIANGVIVTTFVERTCNNDLKQAIDRLQDIGADILGTVVNNVEVKQSYNRYGYGYGLYEDGESGVINRDAVLLLSTEDEKDNL